MTEQTSNLDFDEPLAAALSDYMMMALGRRPTRDELWDIYWSAVEAIEKAWLEAKMDATNHG